MIADLGFDPLFPLWLVALIGGLGLVPVLLAIARGARGGWLRLGVLASLVLALAGPVLVRQEREPTDKIVLMVDDASRSMSLNDRRVAAEAAAEALAARIAGEPDLELRRLELQEDDDGTAFFGPLNEALSELDASRLAAVLVLSDGLVHDDPALLDQVPAPVHLMLAGERRLPDRRLKLISAPRYAVVDKPAALRLEIEDRDLPAAGRVDVSLFLNGQLVARRSVLPGRPFDLSVIPERRGPAVVEVEVEPAEGERFLGNNRGVFTINAVRDRLKVLLVSGEPHAGERVWRQALKADPSVDLIHFTILRLPQSENLVPDSELSLIPFPTNELFRDRLDQFDLVIFDRYTLRGVLNRLHLANLARYVEEGGAMLIATGPEFARPFSLYRTPLGQIMPAQPEGTLMEQGYVPTISSTGLRHPVTAPFAQSAGRWGRWFRLIDAEVKTGEVLMEGPDGRPVLILSRLGEGRVAQFLSDQIWLWARGVEGGGPHQALLRRVAHWLMKEPDLEEEALTAEATPDGGLAIARRSLSDEPVRVTVSGPRDAEAEGERRSLDLSPAGPGLQTGVMVLEQTGLYEVSDGTLRTLVSVGNSGPEMNDLVPTPDRLAPLAEATGGGTFWLEDGVPQVRRVSSRGRQAGDNWLGIHRDSLARTVAVRQTDLLPPWAALTLIAGLLLGAWVRESR